MNKSLILKDLYDEFGDSYLDPATIQSLTLSMEAVKGMGLTGRFEDSEDLESILQNYKYFLFRGLILYLEYGENEKDKQDLDTSLLRFYGAMVQEGSEKVDQKVGSNNFSQEKEGTDNISQEEGLENLGQEEGSDKISQKEGSENLSQKGVSENFSQSFIEQGVSENTSHVIFFKPTPDIIDKYKELDYYMITI